MYAIITIIWHVGSPQNYRQRSTHPHQPTQEWCRWILFVDSFSGPSDQSSEAILKIVETLSANERKMPQVPTTHGVDYRSGSECAIAAGYLQGLAASLPSGLYALADTAVNFRSIRNPLNPGIESAAIRSTSGLINCRITDH